MFAEGQGRRSVAIGVVAFRLRAMKEGRHSVGVGRKEREKKKREGGACRNSRRRVGG